MTEVLDETTNEPDPEEEALEEEGGESGEEGAPSEETPAGEPESEVVQHGPSQVEMEKFYKGVETRRGTFNRWVSEQLGEAYLDLTPCPLCADSIPGLVFPPEWVTPTSELHRRLLEVLKTPVTRVLKEDPFTRVCDTCGGEGKTLTKGHVPNHETRGCETCKGIGYLAFDEHGAAVPSGPVTNGDAPIADDQPLESGEIDIWGSPRLLDSGFENPNYGRMPQYKLPQYP